MTSDTALHVEYNAARCALVDILRNAKYHSDTIQNIECILESLGNDENSLSLLETFRTQVIPALTIYKNSWGKHYINTLPSMLRDERRSNFRDRCLQHFVVPGGLFDSICTNAEFTFATTPPPTPSLLYRGSNVAPTAQLPTQLPEEYMRGGGCWTSESTLTVMRSNKTLAVRSADLQANDWVQTKDDIFAPIRCIVKIPCFRHISLVTLGHLQVTEHHPVFWEGAWRYPSDISSVESTYCEYLYDLVLWTCHMPLVENIPCISLGHGLDCDILAHTYYGTQNVIDDLSCRNGWKEGIVQLHDYDLRVVHDSTSSKILVACE